MMRESVCNPVCFPSGVAKETTIRLGCPARAMLLVIMATTVWDKPDRRLSRWTTRTGRGLAVRRFESGNRASTTSPRLKVIVDIHFGTVPVLGGRAKTPTEFGRFFLAYAPCPQVDGAFGREEGHDHPRLFEVGRRLEQFYLAVSENAWHTRHHERSPE